MSVAVTLQGLAWIAVDWGTSNLRVWAMDVDAHILAAASSDKGMAKLDRAGFEPALLDLIGDWLPARGPTPVIACGMVGARQGWIEAPYRQVPCRPVALDAFGRPATGDPRIAVMVIPGLKQTAPGPDVMRGEETQIAGWLLDEPSFAGVLCLPGTHTKWVRVRAGEIVGFSTFMTGELYGLLAEQSVLRHSVGGDGDAAEFAASVRSASADPNMLSARLFSVRSETLVGDLAPSSARARLSGLLIGAELAAARTYWAGSEVTIVGNGAQAKLYAEALGALGRTPRVADTTKVTLAGLRSAYEQLVKGIR